MSWGTTGDPFDVVVIGDADGAMGEAVTLAGGRVVAGGRPGRATAWSDDGAILALDFGSADLPADEALDALAARADVVACDLDQLDRVAAAMLWTDATLLCAPTLADRVAALAIVGAVAAHPEAVREGTDDRLRRFGGEVARIADTLGRLAAEATDTGLADRRPAYDPGPAVTSPAPIDGATVRKAIRARRLRAQFLDDALFEDPAWDMLLDLFAAELETREVSVTSLCIAAHVAPTTALRWITRLTEAELFERRPDPQDRRRAFVGLSARGSAAMRGYVAALAQAGLALG